MAGVSRIHHLILVFLWHFVEDFSSLGFLTIFTVLFNIQLVSLQPEVHHIEGAFLWPSLGDENTMLVLLMLM